MTDVWHLRTSELAGDALLEACRALLAPEEEARLRSLCFARDRREYLATRGLCRCVLAAYLRCPPGSLRFRRNAHGRPAVDPPGEIGFNLSNTTSLVVCAVVHGCEVGIDIEPLASAARILEVAAGVFTPPELDRLSRLDSAPRAEQAVRLWTLKEAYMKARGLGVSIPPDSFSVDFDDAGAGATLGVAVGEDPARWSFATGRIDDHLVSTCVERIGGNASEPRFLEAGARAMLSGGLLPPAA